AQINTAIQQLDKVTQQNTSAAEEMSATSEELASQAEQLQSAIAYFRLTSGSESAEARAAGKSSSRGRPGKSGKTPLRDQVLAKAPHMSGGVKGGSGGFDVDLGDGGDALDQEFTRKDAA
ncbi:MAG: methyl-accepting chemotaxis protein, partial [Devosia sp.]|nr:methyl-accepting chemotaxis protein [Devosia sp.]